MIDSYEKLTIKKYKEIMVIINGQETEYVKNVQLVAALNDMDVEDVEDLPIGTFNTLLQSTVFLYEEPKQRMICDKYKLGGMELEVMLNLQKMNVAQYIDYQTYVKDTEKYLVEILSVFLIPKGKKYCEGYDVIEVQKVIEDNMSIVDAISMSAFFLALYQSLIKTTVTFLTKKMKRMKRKEKDLRVIAKLEEVIANLEDVGVGLHSLTE